MKFDARLLPAAIAAIASSAPSAFAQTESVIEEVMVTAQKRSESINDVPLSISAATGETMQDQGVSTVEDLTKVTPGFSFQVGSYGSPNYTIRGVGTQSDSYISTPAVSVYVDQAPLAYSVMSPGLVFDIERVEVLKGPQGTLFGQNSTGGAINFIPNKPTSDFHYGANATASNFGGTYLDGFINIPVNDELGIRIAAQTEQGGAWQESFTRDGDELGDRDFFAVRSIIAWDPSDVFSVALTLNHWQDNSDTQAAQYLPGTFVPIASVEPDLLGLVSLFQEADAAYGAASLGDNQVADWSTGAPLEQDTDQVQVFLNTQWQVTDSVLMTSITNFVDHDGFNRVDLDGLSDVVYSVPSPNDIKSFSQEFRFSGSAGDRIEWMVGATYQNDDSLSTNGISTYFSNNIAPFFGQFDTNGEFIEGSQVAGFLEAVGLAIANGGSPADAVPNSVNVGVTPNLAFPQFNSFSNQDPSVDGISSIEDQDLTTLGIFGSLNYDLSDSLRLQTSIRWTESDNDWRGCFNDVGNGLLSTFFSGLPPFPNVQPGGCVTILNDGGFGTPDYNPGAVQAGFVEQELKEDNVSWRVSLDWSPTDGMLAYGNVTRGFKAGNFPRVPGLTAAQFEPNTQEEVTAFELGIKQSLSRAQINAAMFFYDYKDKQAVGAVNTVALGVVPAGVSIPDASIFGVEIDGVWEPVENFRTRFALMYLDSEIESSNLNSTLTDTGTAPAIDPFGSIIDLNGLSLPTTSEWNLNLGFQYTLPMANGNEAYIAADTQYRSEYFTQLSDNPFFEAGDYTTTDLRIGYNFVDSGWGVQLWGRNVGDADYFTSVNKLADHASALTGRPATYGLTVSYKP